MTPQDATSKTSAPPPAPKGPRGIFARLFRSSNGRRRSDQEFLPAALEIIETPQAPYKTALIYLIVAFAVATLSWSYFSRIDIIAVAQGKIQPHGRVKVVQPVEPGKVARIAVKDGDPVEAGDVLIELDAKEARADVDAQRSALASVRAEVVRRDGVVRHAGALIRAPESGDLDLETALDFDETIPADIRAREQGVLDGDLHQLKSQLNSIAAQSRQKEAEGARLRAGITAQVDLLTTMQERVTMRTALAVSGSGSRASLIDAREALQHQESQLIALKAQLVETIAALDVLSKERERIVNTFLADNGQKRNDAARQIDDFRQRLIKAENRVSNLTLRASIAGTVQASSVFTIGQVVAAGQELMRLVPGGRTLEVIAYFPNKDIGFIDVNQAVAVKVDSFPFTRYGFVPGVVEHIAHDAIPLNDLPQIEGDPARATEAKTFAGGQRVQNLAFPVTISLSRTTMRIEDHTIPLSPGMTVTAEIRTGSRRILEYLLSPVVQTVSVSLRER